MPIQKINAETLLHQSIRRNAKSSKKLLYPAMGTLGLASVKKGTSPIKDPDHPFGGTQSDDYGAYGGAFAGCLSGAAVGAAIGSLIVPGLGTAAGAYVGGSVGTIAGAIYGSDYKNGEKKPGR